MLGSLKWWSPPKPLDDLHGSLTSKGNHEGRESKCVVLWSKSALSFLCFGVQCRISKCLEMTEVVRVLH